MAEVGCPHDFAGSPRGRHADCAVVVRLGTVFVLAIALSVPGLATLNPTVASAASPAHVACGSGSPIVISSRSTWTIKNDPLFATGCTVAINQGAELSIGAGVNVAFGAQLNLATTASIVVSGTSTSHVSFSEGTSIVLSGGSSLTVGHAVLKGGRGAIVDPKS
jgi:hypothetical protein